MAVSATLWQLSRGPEVQRGDLRRRPSHWGRARCATIVHGPRTTRRWGRRDRHQSVRLSAYAQCAARGDHSDDRGRL